MSEDFLPINGTDYVEFYVGNVYLGRFDFAPVMTKPEVTIPLRLGHHGLDTQ